MPFVPCCSKPQKIDYLLVHECEFDKETQDVLLDCLWRLPELPSYQADHQTVFSNSAYDEFFIDVLKTQLKLGPEDFDIVVGGNPAIINDSIGQYYEDEICLNCSKLVFHQSTKRTAIEEFFNHLRNMIAHGCFNIVNGTFIGFDHPKYNGLHWTAVLKAPYSLVKSTIESFAGITELSDIYAKCFEALGYTITRCNNNSLFAEKNNQRYMLIIKQYSGRYAQKSDIEEFVNEYEYIDKSNCMFVLVIDSTYATKDIQSFLVTQNIGIIDKSSIKRMMSGEDVLSDIKE